ncbi:uncharacterized protein G2W53_039198 [Senna tora]|uniref:Uncharacterized protein n=1 Tax=Senna tora TaxID=362788 RepID=A0A834W2M5_9FABA|nr:uncharacterized protein G2W53_039198 [Senna tora]
MSRHSPEHSRSSCGHQRRDEACRDVYIYREYSNINRFSGYRKSHGSMPMSQRLAPTSRCPLAF